MAEQRTAQPRIPARLLVLALALLPTANVRGGGPGKAEKPEVTASPGLPAIPPAVRDEPRTLPIDLPTAMKLGNVRGLDIAAAAERLQIALAQLRQAELLWVPTVAFGADYFRHDGKLQDIEGKILTTSKSSLMVGAGSGLGSSAVISFNDAFFAPLAARRVTEARQADVRTAANDTLLEVTEAYLTVQQARGELAGAVEVSRFARDLEQQIAKLAEGLVPPLESVRAQVELARRQQAELTARERWRVASADLLRVLALDPAVQVEPAEPPHLRICFLDPNTPLDDLLTIALGNRPELAGGRALIAAAEAQVRQEQARPFVPSLLLRGASTNPAGTLGGGLFGGGINSNLGNFGGRFDYDVQLLWQLDNLGFGNAARVRQRQAENRLAHVELARMQNRVTAEVSQALAQVRLASQRAGLAEKALKLSQESLRKNLLGLRETKRVGETAVLVVRPQEAVAAVQALAQAYADYYGAIADANRAQFRLYRALGQPAQVVCSSPAK